MKNNSVKKLAAILFRWFYQFWPFELGKWFIWSRFLDIYINNLEETIVVKSKNGAKFKLSLNDYIQQRLFYFGVWEPNLTHYISNNLSPGDVFVDVGANIGYYSLLASYKVGDQGKVFSIEASPSIFDRLQTNIALNDAKNIISYNVAASNYKGKLDIFIGHDSNIGQTTTQTGNAEAYQFKKEAVIDANCLDKIVGEINILNARIIKIDVEGAEWQVIQGIKECIPRFGKNTEIIIEITPKLFLDPEFQPRDLINLFINNGYSPYVIEDNNSLYKYMQSNRGYKISRLKKDILEQENILFSNNELIF